MELVDGGQDRLFARTPIVVSARLATKVKRLACPWRRRARLCSRDNGVSSAVINILLALNQAREYLNGSTEES